MKKFLFAGLLALFAADAWAQLATSVAVDDVNIYVGSPQYTSFVVIDRKSDQMTFYNPENSNMSVGGNNFFGGILAKNGEAWVMYGAGNVGHYKDGRLYWRNVPVQGQISRPQFDSKGHIWAAIEGANRFVQLSSVNMAFEYESESFGLPYSLEQGPYDLGITRDGTIWARLNRGMRGDIVRHKKYGEMEFFKEAEDAFAAENNGLKIANIALDGKDQLWTLLMTNEKKNLCLATFDGKAFTKVKDITDQMYHSILGMEFDEHNRLWIMFWKYVEKAGNPDEKTKVLLPCYYEEGKIHQIAEIALDSPYGSNLFYAPRWTVYDNTVYISHSVLSEDTSIAVRERTHYPHVVLYTADLSGRVTARDIDPEADAQLPTSVDRLSAADGSHARLYDLQGRQLQAEPEKGIYIKDGKKFVK
ncbi:MAG: hypothetical protein IJ196_05060 [Prevotella sp.]|nr:hypothetical protein [Prevotella sp.]